MGGTRIFVLHMKQLIKIAIIAVIGLILLIMLLILLIPKRADNAEEPSSSLYNPGTYSSFIVLNNKPLDVSVTVNDNEITSVALSDMALIQRTFYPCFEPVMSDMADAVLFYQTADIEMSTEFPVTASILQQAVEKALEKAYNDAAVSVSTYD